MQTDVLDLVWKYLQQELNAIRSSAAIVTARSERAETAGGVPSLLYGSLPHYADGAGKGDLIYVENGRKVGEAAGAGTGVLAYFDITTDSWFRASDDTAVVI